MVYSVYLMRRHFRNNRIKIGSVGAERHLIEYREYSLDENGNRILDDNGFQPTN